MLALFVAGLETPSKRLILAVLLIAVGTAIASYGEVNLSWVGVACMMASETFEATRLVMTQILLVGLKFHPSEQIPVCSRCATYAKQGNVLPSKVSMLAPFQVVQRV